MAALIRCGKLCNHCTHTQCKDIGTDCEPIDIECPLCDGEGCDHCQSGDIRIDGCPKEYCSSVAMTARLSDLFQKGIPPIAGGVLDQSVWFIEADSILRSDEAQIRFSK